MSVPFYTLKLFSDLTIRFGVRALGAPKIYAEFNCPVAVFVYETLTQKGSMYI